MRLRWTRQKNRIEIIKKVFEENEITVSEPTSLQIPLSFNEGELFFFTENEREETVEFLSQFIDDFVKPRSDRVFMGGGNNPTLEQHMSKMVSLRFIMSQLR